MSGQGILSIFIPTAPGAAGKVIEDVASNQPDKQVRGAL